MGTDKKLYYPLIRFIFSKQGQAEVLRLGYVPVSARIAREQLDKVGLGDPSKKKE